jgi:hypothetical protein
VAQEALREAAAAEALAAIEAAGDNGHNIQVPSTQVIIHILAVVCYNSAAGMGVCVCSLATCRAAGDSRHNIQVQALR